MKAVAALSAKVTESICQLPGVAILDWCDRAAAALTRLHPHACCTVAVATLDPRSTIVQLEAAGASTAGHDATALDPRILRESFREGHSLGWDVRPLSQGQVQVEAHRLTPSTAKRSAPPLNQRFDALQPGEVQLAAIGLAPAPRGNTRVLIAEVAVPHSQSVDAQRTSAVLASVLPMVASRYLKAVGSAPASRHSWLTPREELILWKLVAGKKVPVIAGELHRSVYTVHDHVKSLHRKLGATNRGQLVSRALGHLGPLLAKADEATIPEDAED
ncbi:MAG: response regulator transcription factor [Phycisphaerales bacterium]